MEKQHIQIISAKSDCLKEYVLKIFRNRFLIQTLAKRDLKIKYAQMWLGLGWTIGSPLISVAIYTLFFGYFLHLNTFKYPYLLYILSGLIAWNIFSQLYTNISSSLLSNRDIITKMAFPKIIIPLSKVINVLFENVFLFLFFIVAFALFYVPLDWKIIIFPFALLGLILTGFSIGLLLAALSIKKRDVSLAAPNLINMSVWVTPVFYPVSIIPEAFQNYIYINPVAAYLDIFRWSFGLIDDINHFSAIGILLSCVLFLTSFLLFKKSEDFIVEYI
jgi:lipopolysaccharide transport system permease protein